MSTLMEKMVAWWESLGPSDRRVLKIAAPVIVLLLLYLVLIQPILGHYLDVKNQRQRMQENLVWLYENAALVSRMQNACVRERPVVRGNDSLSAYVQNIGRRAGAETSVQVINNRELDIRVDSIAGARALGLVQSYICSGFEVANLNVTRGTPDTDEVGLSARLTAASVIAGAGQ